MKRWWMLVYLDAERVRCVGSAVVRGSSLEDAIGSSVMYGCNPGGELSAVQVPEAMPLDRSEAHRLLSPAQTVRLTMRLGEHCESPELGMLGRFLRGYAWEIGSDRAAPKGDQFVARVWAYVAWQQGEARRLLGEEGSACARAVMRAYGEAIVEGARRGD